MGYNHAVFGFAPYSPFWREMRKIATLELLSNRRLEMLKHVRTSEIDIGIRELYTSWVQNDSRPLLVELNWWLDELTLNVVVRMVAGKRYFGASATCDDGEARRCQKAISQFFHLIGIFVVSDALPFLWWLVMYKLNVLASARIVCNIMVLQVRGRTHRELYFLKANLNLN
jgi:hypothetical protein